MNILVISQYYYPEQFRVNDICEEFVKRGHNITVLTGLPNYPKGEIFPDYRDGKKRNEIINGVKVIRCNIIPRRQGIQNLALNYYSYAQNATKIIDKLDDTFDVIFVYQMSPVTMAFPGIKAKRKMKIPLVLYCFDLWPASILDANIKRNGVIYRFVRAISRYIYNKCDRIIVTSPSFEQYLRDECLVKKIEIQYVPQHAEDKYSEDLTAIDNGIIDFMFLGNIGLSQNCESIIEAIRELDRNLPFKVHFVGDGSKKTDIESMVKKYCLEDKVTFHGFQPMDKLNIFYKIADVCILTLAYENEIGLTIPAKLQGYMAACKPIVAAISGDAAKIIDDAKCGYHVEAGDSHGLSRCMKRFIDNPENMITFGQNGREYFDKHFTKNSVINQLEFHLKKIKGYSTDESFID